MRFWFRVIVGVLKSFFPKKVPKLTFEESFRLGVESGIYITREFQSREVLYGKAVTKECKIALIRDFVAELARDGVSREIRKTVFDILVKLIDSNGLVETCLTHVDRKTKEKENG
jgi:hypothetical protein